MTLKFSWFRAVVNWYMLLQYFIKLCATVYELSC